MFIILILIAILFYGILKLLVNSSIDSAITSHKASRNREQNMAAPRHTEFVKIVDRDEADSSSYVYIIENEDGIRRRVFAYKSDFVITVGDTGMATYYTNHNNYCVLERFERK